MLMLFICRRYARARAAVDAAAALLYLLPLIIYALIDAARAN